MFLGMVETYKTCLLMGIFDVAAVFLQELVLRDNQLKKIPDVAIFRMLLVFDVSFNEISSLSGLSKVSNTLKELYVSKNEVTKMEEIEHFHELQILELGSNRLRVWFICYFSSFYAFRSSQVPLTVKYVISAHESNKITSELEVYKFGTMKFETLFILILLRL